MNSRKLYLTWLDADENGDGDYFEIYDSIYEAVCGSTNKDSIDGVEVFEATPKSLGKFTLKHSAVKVRRAKK